MGKSIQIDTLEKIMDQTARKFIQDAQVEEGTDPEEVAAYLGDYVDAVLKHIKDGVPYKSYCEESIPWARLLQ